MARERSTTRRSEGQDPDGDVLTNLEEQGYGTSPTLADTDGDGWTDGEEIALRRHPVRPAPHPPRRPLRRARKRRDETLASGPFAAAKQRLASLERAWSEVAALDAVCSRARRLLEVHPLTSADALHLGAALLVTEERPEGVGFVSFDARLFEAAAREGFDTLGA